MISQLFKPSAVRSAGFLGRAANNRLQARYLATVQSNTERAIPTPSMRKATAVSNEPATFTIKVGTVIAANNGHQTHRSLERPHLFRQVIWCQNQHFR